MRFIYQFKEFNRTLIMAKMPALKVYFLSSILLLVANSVRDCLYSNSSKTQIINLQHELWQSQQCMVCLPQCRSCLSSRDTTCANGNCESRYYFQSSSQVCRSCQNMCEQCTDISTCEKCIDGYYLNSNGQCLQCMSGVLACTSSSILQCSDGYYYDSQTYVCRRCSDTNCAVCSAKGSCDQCSTGYLLNSGSSACLSCGVANCTKCLSTGTCQTCAIGYRLQSNTYCIKQNCTSINKCKQCTNNSNIITCTLCQAGFYLLDNSCHYGSSLMCQYSLTPIYISQVLKASASTSANSIVPNTLTDYGSCASCNKQVSKRAQNGMTYCIPKQVGSDGSKVTQFRIYNQYNHCTMPHLQVSQPAPAFVYNTSMSAAYAFQLTLVAVLSNASGSILSYANLSSLFGVAVSANSSAIGSTAQGYPLYCTTPVTQSAYIFKYTLLYKILTDYPITAINTTTTATTVADLSVTISLNTSIPQLSNSQLSIKESYFQLSLCTVPNCLQCLSATSCTKCKYPYLIQDFVCVMMCDMGYYLNKNTQSCSSRCIDGYYPSTADNQCVACPVECVLCANASYCSKCSLGYFLTVDSQCKIDCSNGSQLSMYYPNSIYRQCRKCTNPCKTCGTDPNNCTSCLIGFQVYSNSSNGVVGVCVFKCPVGYYQKVIISANHQTNPQCLLCSSSCLQCDIQGNLCTACVAGQYLHNSACLSVCPDGYYGSPQNAEYGQPPRCRPCAYPCSKCNYTSSNCTQCQYGLLLFNYNGSNVGQCTNVCPSQLYYTDLTTRRCPLCPTNCITCTLAQNTNQSQYQVCATCTDGFVQEYGACVSACTNAWAVNGSCQTCPYPCTNCTGTSASNYSCTSCVKQFYLSADSKCVLICGTGYYSNSTSLKCQPCPSSCRQCTLPTNITAVQCISCVSNYSLSNYACIPLSGGCPSSTYLSVSPWAQCLPCSPSCQQCNVSSIKCTSCKNNTFLLEMYSECVSSCPYGYINNLSALKCTACIGMCSECSIISNNCTQCKQGAYLYMNITSNSNTCLLPNQCSSLSGYYANTRNQVCSVCVYPCTQCSSESICSACAVSTYLYKNSCVPECPTGHYPNVTVCLACPTQCMSCTSESVCLTCKPNYLYRQASSQCLSSCGMYEYPNHGSMSCETCKLPCMQCSSMQYCLTCAIVLVNGTEFTPILFNGQCLDHCYDGYYMVSNNAVHECKPCNISCETCVSLTNCSTCTYGYYLYLNQCIKSSECPALSYADANTRTCSLCQPPCVLCQSRYECLSCVAGHLLKQGSCYINCPIGTYPNGTACAQCPTSCTRCSKYSECQACVAGAYLFTNMSDESTACVSKCPTGSFLSSSSKQCQACSPSCLSCSMRASNCTWCPSSHALQDSQCVSNCSKFYYYRQLIQRSLSNYIILKHCQKCNTSCSNCINFDVCNTCVSSYLVTTNITTTEDNIRYYASYCSNQCPPATFKNSQLFICQKCQYGCLQCTSQINCLSCSTQLGYVLYNIKCLPSPCQAHLYTIVDQNKCVDKSYCQANTQLYFIYQKNHQCFRKDRGQCPSHLVMKNQNQCVDQCPDGYLADFNMKCVRNTENVDDYKFVVTPIRKNGYIQMLINFNAQMNQEWVKLFNNITVSQGIKWKSQNKNTQISQSRRLLIKGLQFQVIEDTSGNLNNALKLLVFFTNPFPEPTDLTFLVSMNSPYTNLISINGKPLQNWQAQTTIKSYILTERQMQNHKSKNQGIRALPIILIIFAVVLTILNLTKSGKIYLLIPTWDFMQLLYLMNYLPIYWPFQIRLFLDTFSVTWLRWFHSNDSSILFSPQKVHAIATYMNLIRNILCNVVLIGFTFLAYGICVLVKVLMKLGKKKQINNKQENAIPESKKQRRVNEAINIIKKIIMGVCYLSISNILYFALVNVFYRSSQHKNSITFWYVLSVMIIIALPALLLYAFYLQMQDKNIFDAGVNPLKQRIIICLPIYLMLRKLFIVFFLGIMSYDAAFPICFGFVATAFIFILISWFQPYNNSIRYKLSLLNQAILFIFLIFSFIYICNQRDMMQGGYTSFLIFLAVVAIIVTFIYPTYHLYCLLEMKKRIFKFLNIQQSQQKIGEQKQNQKLEGICIEQIDNGPLKTKNDMDEQKQCSVKNDVKNQYQPPVDSDTFSCAQVLNSITQKDDKTTNNAEKPENTKEKKKKKIKLPKDSLIPGQTDHQADQSSQEGEKNKMKLADYTTRLTKRGPPAVKKFKNYDINQNDSQNDDEGLAEKQIQLSKLIERQRTMVRNQTKIKEPQQEIAQQVN